MSKWNWSEKFRAGQHRPAPGIANAPKGSAWDVPKIFGTDGALPRDISLSGEDEARPASHFAGCGSLKETRAAEPHILAGHQWIAQAQSTTCPLSHYFRILATTPAPTVRPPSRIANRRPSSIATGLISVTFIFTLSPGITISTPSGSSQAPVMSVVRK